MQTRDYNITDLVLFLNAHNSDRERYYMLTKIAAPPIIAPMAIAAVGIEPPALDVLVPVAVALALALSRALLAESRAERREVEAAPFADEMLDLMSLIWLVMLEATEAASSVLLATADVMEPLALSIALEAAPTAEDASFLMDESSLCCA